MGKKVIVIGAISQDGVYGIGDNIPWKIKEELQHFYTETVGSTVIMGRRTWELIPEKYRPLPGRANMVITSTPGYVAEGAEVFVSLQQAVEATKTEKVFCIGGRSLWYEAMYFADEAVITVVRKDCWVPGALEADELLNPAQKWRRFRLASSDGTKAVGNIPFDICRWVTPGN